MRNMSFSMTIEAVRRHEKTVTRRLGWGGLLPETMLHAIEKGQGLKKGEHVKTICTIRVVEVRYEYLWRIREEGKPGTAAEGFPELTPDEFVTMFCRANHCDQDTVVARIEFEYVDER
jgi:hypothetical protein